MDYAAQLEELLGLRGLEYRYNQSKKELFHEAIANDKGRIRKDGPRDEQKAYATQLGDEGPLVYYTDPEATGRRVLDTFAAAYPEIEDKVWWKSDFGKYDPDHYEGLLERVVAYLNEKGGHLYVQDLYCGQDPTYAVPYRFVGEYATHALFCRIMFPKGIEGVADEDGRRWTLLNVPSFLCEPDRDGSRSDAAIVIDFRRRIALVAGPADYCGTNKKTMFTVLNFMLPDQGFLPMHCSANVGEHNDAAILFGLSGTGKTTLSADPHRKLIGDDETGWTDEGVSNFEDGCYAKLIDLNKEAEPVIAAALEMPGTLIENVPPLPGKKLADTHPQELDLTDKSITENTRFAYGLECNPMVMEGAKGPHPQTIVMLTADAFGVLPPVSLLTKDEAMYHFVQGFTSKLAGTEVGVTEPKAAFSACFGAPFMSRFPSVYAELLAKKMVEAGARCILLNTGWTGGPYGVGKRMSLKYTRAMLNAALSGKLDDVPCDTHPVFKMRVPTTCPDVPDEILNPRNTWSDKDAYDAKAAELLAMFQKNYEDKNFGELGIPKVM
ncbi:MAG TPA: phosphoenolpyruvate carboxykinase (ATP) [Planctomycetes bacterium]|nr:phosphoenolpyruvate carboxykinase (ATP) [Planctomycetota bacterium]